VHLTHLLLQADGSGDLEIGKSVDLSLPQQLGVQGVDIDLLECLINVDDVFQLIEEPLVDLGQIMNLVDGIALMHGLGDHEHALVGGFTERGIDVVDLQLLVFHKTVHALSDHAQTLLDGLFKVATDGHYLSDALHAGAKLLVHAAEFGEIPARNLANHIVEGRLEECRRGLGDRVFQLEQSVTHTQLGSHESQRIPRGLGGKGRRAAQAGVHLDDTVVFAVRIEGILHVTFAHDADVTHNLDAQLAELMILAVGERLRRSDHDRLAGMDAERVEILHVTHRDTVVVTVSHHLIFYLFPAFQTLLHQYLGRERECLFTEFGQFFVVLGEARTQSAQRVCGAHDDRITQSVSGLLGLFGILASLTLDGLDIDLVEFLNEQLAILSIHDGANRRAQHSYVVLLEHTALVKLHSTVERRLSAKAQQDAVGALFLYDTLHEIRLNGQEVDLVGHALRCLYGGDIGVDEHRLDALLTQSL